MQLIMEAQGEAAVVISTHLPGEIETYLDRMLILQNGRLCIDEDADALRTRFGRAAGSGEALHHRREGVRAS